MIAGLIAALISGEPLGASLIVTAGLVVLVRVALGGASDVAGAWTGQQVTAGVRADVLAAIAALGPSWLAERRSGEVVSTVMEQTDAVEGFVSRYLPAQKLSSAIPLTLLAVVLLLDWQTGLILLGFGVAVPVAMGLVGWRTAARARGQMTAMRRMSGYFLDRLQNLTTLKLFGAELRERAEMRAVSDGFRERTMSVLRLAFLSSTTLELLSGLAIATVAVTLIADSASGGAGERGLIFVILLVPELFLPLRRLGQFYHDKAAAVGAAEAILEVLDAADALPSTENVSIASAGDPPSVSVEGLSLAYESGGRIAVDNVSFTVGAGEMVALVGESGSGKSSILDVLAGFRPGWSGQVRVNGRAFDPVQVRPISARAGQAPRILAGTLAENLRLGRPDAEEADLWRALEAVGLADLARGLPGRLETTVGEGGRGLSGGEARRIGLARTIVRQAKLVLLDEPTSNLDGESEAGVLAGIDALRMGRTVIIATHSKAVMDRADRIITLDHGRIQPEQQEPTDG
jgi:thiol reductant ABC exporter CydD subunit